MQLHDAQKKVAKCMTRFRVLSCGRRFGKTTLAAYEMLGKALAKNDRRVAYYAPTRDDARDIMWAMLMKIVGEAATYLNDSRLEMKVKTKQGGESLIVLYGWESVQERGKGRGVANDFVVLDEVASYRGFHMGWQEVIRPTLTDTKGEAMFISTPKGFNHFYDLFNEDRKDPDYKSFHFTSYDNPHIPVEELEKAKKELTEDRFSQEYLADFRKTEGLVYKEFSREHHLFDDKEKISAAKVIGGVDFGFSNPCAIIEVKKDRNGRYFVFERMYKPGKTDAEVADFVATLKWNECFPDPESASGIEELRRRRVNVREVLKNKDSIRNGISIVRELFKAGRLFIHKDCDNLIWELENYSYPDKKDLHNESENPIKEHDHACDALRYALQMQHEETYLEDDKDIIIEPRQNRGR